MSLSNVNISMKSILGFLREIPLSPDDKRWLASKLYEDASLEDGKPLSNHTDGRPSYRMRDVAEMAPEIQQLVGIIPQDTSASTANDREDMNGDRYRTEYLREKYGL